MPKKEGEDFETFFFNVQQASIDAELTKEHCEDCAKKCLDSKTVAKITAAITDKETRTKLLKLKEEEFNLEKVVMICRNEENSRRNEQKLSHRSINVLHRKANPNQRSRSKSKQRKPEKVAGFPNQNFLVVVDTP